MEEKLSRLLRRGKPLKTEAEDLLKINRETAGCGLTLSRDEALRLAQVHRNALDECGRVEVGPGTVEKLALAFRNSQYLDSGNFASVLAEATEAFYALKNESEDTIPDDELVSLLANGFERFGGTLSAYLGSEELDRLLRARRCGAPETEEKEEEDVPGEEDEQDE